LPWSAAHVAYSLIRPMSQIPNIRDDGTLSIENFMLMMKKPKNLEFEPLFLFPDPKIVTKKAADLFYGEISLIKLKF
jgi:hypothetical protein